MRCGGMLLAALSLCAAGAVRGAEAVTGDFEWHATLATERNEGLHQLTLDQDALLAATQAGLRDLRVFNANGEALPLARLPAPAPAQAGRGPPRTLKMVPLPASPQAQDRALADYAVRLVRERDRTTLEIAPTPSEGAAATPREPGAYLLDLRPLKDLQGELQLHFAADAPDYANTATVLGSDDLVSWRLLASGPLAHNRQLGDSAIERGSFALQPPPAFARVTWPAGAAPALGGASFSEQLAATITPLSRTPLELAGLADGGWLIALPAGLPITRIAIHAPQPNQALRVDLLCPQNASPYPYRHHLLRELANRSAQQPWYPCRGGIEVYKADRGGQWVENPPFEMPMHPAQMQLRVVQPKDYRGAPPQVEVEWQPVRLAFLARAPGPYQLAVGSETAADGPVLDLASLLSRDDPAGVHLPAASVAQSDTGPIASRAQQSARAQSRWRWSLWAVLLLAVGALSALAWQLLQNLRR